MTRTYGQAMKDFERDSDERDWKRKMYRTLQAASEDNDDYLREIVMEGLEDDFDFSEFENNPRVYAILHP